MTTLPTIALTAGHTTDTRPYIRAIEKAGGTALLLYPGAEDSDFDQDVAGVVFAGGDSVHPSRYGAELDPTIEHTSDEERDRLEWAVLAYALDNRLPVLGICRGMQLINVYHGGTLHQHLPDQTFADVHLPTGPRNYIAHKVQALGGRLAGILGTQPLPVNSIHQQGIDVLGKHLTPTVQSEDGLVEGIETDTGSIVAVQWHPEELIDSQTAAFALFTDLVERAREIDLENDNHTTGTPACLVR